MLYDDGVIKESGLFVGRTLLCTECSFFPSFVPLFDGRADGWHRHTHARLADGKSDSGDREGRVGLLLR